MDNQDSLDSPWSRLKSKVLSVEAVRRVDQMAIKDFGISSLVLMENAGLGCVNWLRRKFPTPQRTLILCGSGNNGGDGLVIARHLEVLGWPCELVIQGPIEKLSDDSSANLRILKPTSADWIHLSEGSSDSEGSNIADALELIRRESARADLIIDAMLGTGTRGNPRPPLDQWIRLSNAASAYRVALDIPTGVDATSGETAQDYFHADCTITFVAKKPAMQLSSCKHLFGQIEVLPIGIPAQLIELVLAQDTQ